MAFKMAGYSYPGKSPKKQMTFEDKLKEIEAETPEQKEEREDKNQQILVDAINRESKKKSPKPQKDNNKSWIGEKLSNLDKKLSKTYIKDQEEKWGKSDPKKYNRDGTLRKQG